VPTSRRRRPGRAPTEGPFGPTLAGVLREARAHKGLTQGALAASLGLHQRQISDLERTKVDTRLSTLQNVARALDLELVLIPRQLISTVQSLQRSDRASAAASRPLYALEDPEPSIRPPRRSRARP
jgi:transcriptional regulator with XRE-family HTH domain